MKKIALIIITISLALSASAKGGFYFGPSVGMNISTITKLPHSKAMVKGNLGLMLGVDIANIVGIQAEALYSWQGSKVKSNNVAHNIDLGYIKVPITARVRIIAGLNVEAGVSFDFLVDKDPLVKDPKKMDVAIPVGVNYLFFDRLEIGARYYISTVRIPGLIDNPSKNSLFTINARFRF